jgi:hypothetical protein
LGAGVLVAAAVSQIPLLCRAVAAMEGVALEVVARAGEAAAKGAAEARAVPKIECSDPSEVHHLVG